MARNAGAGAGVGVEGGGGVGGGERLRGPMLFEQLLKSTLTPRVLGAGPGGTGFFQLDDSPGILRRNYRNPVLVASVAGLGAKLDVALRLRKVDAIGPDLVATCLNEIVAKGAEPLFLVPSIALGPKKRSLAAEVAKGIAACCREAGCAVPAWREEDVPGLVLDGRCELVAFGVGVAERARLVRGELVKPGDQVIGLFSSAIPAEDFSLLRRIFFEDRRGAREAPCRLAPDLVRALLEPTRSYVRPLLSLLRTYRSKRVVRAMASIRKGSVSVNLARLLPPEVNGVLWARAWEAPEVFRAIQAAGRLTDTGMYTYFGMGIGMAIVVAPHFLDSILRRLRASRVPAAHIGEIVPGTGKVRLERDSARLPEGISTTRR